MKPLYIRFFVLVCCLLSLQQSFAQAALLDSLVLDSLPAITSMEEALKDPDKVIKLVLHRKKLRTFPPEIFRFKNLQYLDLSKNDIKVIPPEIGQLKDLQYFSISRNQLETLPPEIGECTALYYLNANRNNLETLPATIGKLRELRNLDLWSNNIDSYPSEIQHLKKLKVMDLRVILIPDEEQDRVQSLVPWAKVHFSPYCKCQQ